MQDIFLRKDNYKDEPWYNELLIFCAIGVCQPKDKEHIKPLREVLAVLDYETRMFSKDGKDYIAGGTEQA